MQENMALSCRFFVVLIGAALSLLFSRAIGKGEVGVNYGRVANDLPKDQSQVAKLLKDNGITKVRIYDTNAQVLTSLANTGIKVQVMLPNEEIAAAASDPSYARQWVQSNVAPYLPAGTMIQNVAVGNEVFASNPELTSKLVPAMRNVHDALAALGLDGTVKVSTPLKFDVLQEPSFPPSKGRFKDNLVPVMKDLLDFIQLTGSCLTVNIYPFFAYNAKPDEINLDYALGNSNPGVPDDDTGLMYYSLLDAQIDALHYAIDALGSGGVLETKAVGPRRPPPVCTDLTECGWPSAGAVLRRDQGTLLRRRLLANGGGAASVANAQAFNQNLINRIVSGNTGTPYRPDADLGVYIFALFNENNKGGPDNVESNFGLFYPDMTKVYPFSFQGTGPSPTPVPTPPQESWCVANEAVGEKRLQAALDYACGNGADCSAIRPGGSCFDPDTVLAHASYAINSYYQKNNRVPRACDFNGAASIVYQKPADTCGMKPPMSWCVANAGVGNDRLQAALDYACNNGADCNAIKPGGSCFQPDTVFAHASYAFNSYYQNKGRASGSCDFSGAGSVVYQQPDNTCGAVAATWCVANSAVGDERLQNALDYACNNGADCSAIQSGGACFEPNTKFAHASYAFNSYYQRKGRAAGTCDFSGAGSIVNQAPKFGNCVLPSNG